MKITISVCVPQRWFMLISSVQKPARGNEDENNRMVNVDTLKHSNVREIGAEWMCYKTWQKLGLDNVLIDNGFSENEVQLAQTQVISRAVHPASELATA